MDSEYLCRVNKPKVMHLWTGSNTECKSYANGGMKQAKYQVWKTNPQLPVCDSCQRAWDTKNGVKSEPKVSRRDIERKARDLQDLKKKVAKRKKRIDKSNRYIASLNVNSDAFLSSYEWRRLRLVILKKYGSKCQCCGATPESGAVMNVDHIKPRKIYPELALTESNLQVLCHECNHGKGNWDMTDFRPQNAKNGTAAKN